MDSGTASKNGTYVALLHTQHLEENYQYVWKRGTTLSSVAMCSLCIEPRAQWDRLPFSRLYSVHLITIRSFILNLLPPTYFNKQQQTWLSEKGVSVKRDMFSRLSTSKKKKKKGMKMVRLIISIRASLFRHVLCAFQRGNTFPRAKDVGDTSHFSVSVTWIHNVAGVHLPPLCESLIEMRFF